MVFDGIIISLIVGILRRGSFKNFSLLNLRYGWIFPLLLVIEIIVFSFQNQFKVLGEISSYIFMAVYVVGLLFLFINRKNPGFVIIFIGVFLNFLVMVLNGGRMPVSVHAATVLDPGYIDALKSSLYAKHEVLNQSTKLGFLGDIIPLTKPYPHTQIISIGDVIMNIGIFLFIQHLMVRLPRNKKGSDIKINLKAGETK
jgi:hypothetical protein